MRSPSGRHVIGAVTVDLIKFLKNHEKTAGARLKLSDSVRSVLERRVVVTEWIALEAFLELLAVTDKIAVHGDEQRALEMGAAGGAAIRGVQKAYCVPGDPKASVIAMRHAWRAHYDFARLSYAVVDDDTLEFTLEDYRDLPMVHALMTAGWGVAAARAAGANNVSVEVLERPWQGAARFRYLTRFAQHERLT